ncbi:Uncharacterised protein [Helicobacter canis]|uniref:Uncharacterized protein n=1 Tax=Helicobacter canis TaxID=29419 RepID=A0A377J637_9HELI|nr:Uncharacterised protein [Helicobacter canis]
MTEKGVALESIFCVRLFLKKHRLAASGILCFLKNFASLVLR